MDKYVIDGATLTAIADAIRNYIRVEEGYEVPETITPERMPEHIEVGVADSNYDLGFTDGYNNGYNDGKATGGGVTLPTLTNAGTATDLAQGKQLIDSEGNIVEGTLPAPLVLQAQSTPTRFSFDGDYYFQPSGYREFFDYEIVTDSDSCDFVIFNKTNRYLKVLCGGSWYDMDDSSTGNTLSKSGIIAPNSTGTISVPAVDDSGRYGRNPFWEECYLDGVRFI